MLGVAVDVVAADERPLVNKRELAQLLGVSLPTLDRLMHEPGFPVENRGALGRAWEFDPEAVVEWIRTRKAAEARAARDRGDLLAQFDLPGLEPAAAEGPITPAQRLALIRARTAEREYDIRTGMLVDRAELRQVLTEAMARLGRGLDTLPTQLGSRFHLPDGVVGAMKAAIDEARRRLVDEPRQALREDEAA